jgi:hypothetical protein
MEKRQTLLSFSPYNGEKTDSSTNLAGKSGYPHAEN